MRSIWNWSFSTEWTQTGHSCVTETRMRLLCGNVAGGDICNQAAALTCDCGPHDTQALAFLTKTDVARRLPSFWLPSRLALRLIASGKPD